MIRTFLKKILRTAAYLLFVMLAVIVLLEVCYRFSLFDFYTGNFQLLNPALTAGEKDDRPAILVMGDSFSADSRSYVCDLRDSLPQYRVFNAAVPGTTVRQSNLMIKRRIRQTRPEILVYQIYTGNDLFEFRHRTAGAPLSLIRKSYWWLSDRFWVLAYINARLPRLRQALLNDLPGDYAPKELREYDPERYAKRTRLQFLAEPQGLENTILLKEKRSEDFFDYLSVLQEMLEKVPSSCRVILLVIPHCAQLNDRYLSRMEEQGAVFREPEKFKEDLYPFFENISGRIKRVPVEYVNALPLLREADREIPVYYDNDPHLNAAGQRMIGTRLATLIEK